VHKASLVISSADPRSTFLSLIGAPNLDAEFANRVTQIRGKGVVAKLTVALKGLPQISGIKESEMGNRFLVAPSMRYIEKAFNHSKYGEYSAHPVMDFTIPTIQSKELAPPGHHIISVNVAYAPYQLEGGWKNHKEEFAQNILADLGEFIPGLESIIVGHELLTPPDIENQYLNTQGHWHHGELSIHQSLMLRPLYGAAQYNTPIDNLFLCGAGCHPGGDLCGLPGHNAAKRILAMGVVQ
jgi:phytoene dehydrogenase-like protein